MRFHKKDINTTVVRNEFANARTSNRFAQYPSWAALLLLAFTLLLIGLAARQSSDIGLSKQGSPAGDQVGRAIDDRDLILYDRIIDRLRNGSGYYQAAVAEHRAGGYPLRPGLTVRLPTLATLQSLLPAPKDPAQRGRNERVAAILLFTAILIGWQQRLSEELGSTPLRLFALVLLAIGGHISTLRSYLMLHEMWAGALLALSIAYYRPDKGKWIISWLAAGAALAIRELALPFVILMVVQALWYCRWSEAFAWIGLIVLFAAGLTLHLMAVAAQVSPNDLEGLPWLTLRGPEGWISMIVESSHLRHLPHLLAGPLVVLMVFGWAGWRTQIGAFCTLLFLAYGAAFMIVGREDNWYWGLVIAPAMWLGLAFAPMAIQSLLKASFLR